eukprot:Plantae.Rhodophyta-Rhodochaete_pulchella.ctg18482.p1 GENE.Plantae.Rhodophyta-Rhodochaete_pulchella.ctg18482~~Plantae.Rhodophyta-Rhodochaete_pulchella.ctg18482.p1  ORF type:complete len:417 (+),score=60.16 Plantae.Rhodophyta-Rhodochaete_pulchella.ctg18482:974-2224(+)
MISAAFVLWPVLRAAAGRAPGARGRPKHCPRRAVVRSMVRDFWVEPAGRECVTSAVECGFQTMVFRDRATMSEYRGLARFRGVLVKDDGSVVEVMTVDDAAESEEEIGVCVAISGPSDQDRAMDSLRHSPLVLMEPAGDWKVIPAENVIAAAQHSSSGRSQVMVSCSSSEEAKVLLETLDVGVDGVLLRTDDVHEIRKLRGLRDDTLRDEQSALLDSFRSNSVAATVTAVRAVGSGDRVCVDTCSLLAANEGMLVGSSSQRMFVVLSEAAEVDYVPSRPFRVNAGPVHAYTMGADQKTKYLAELRTGDEVLAVTVDPNTGEFAGCRRVVVGRVKIERRALLLVEADVAKTPESGEARPSLATILVQNAETVRLAGGAPGSVSISASSLRPGNKLLVKTDTAARHIGIPIKEALIEG